MSVRLPIVEQWKESFTAFKNDDRRVTVQGSAWVIRNARVFDVQEHMVVLDTDQKFSTDSYGARELQPAMRALVSYDSIAGISFERSEQDESPAG